ncbi:MAG: hypothetical protein WBA74_03505, partial [Cyclobacteriaceae bacterium]
GLYWQFIGIIQLLAGLLLMTQRFARLGALLFLVIIANIAFITYSYDFNYTPVVTTLMLLTGIMFIVWDWDSFKFLLNLDKPNAVNDLPVKPSFEKEMVWEVTGIALFLFTCTYRLMEVKYNIFFWLVTCMIIGFTGLIFGVIKKRRLARKESMELIA